MIKPLTVGELTIAYADGIPVKLTNDFLDYSIKNGDSERLNIDLQKLKEKPIKIIRWRRSVTHFEFSIMVDEKDISILMFNDSDGYCNGIPIFALWENYNKDDICKKCGSLGKTIRTACVCQKCGNVIWGF